MQERLKDAGVGHFVDAYARLFDSFVKRYKGLASSYSNPKHVLGMYLNLVYEAMVNIDDPEKLKTFLYGAATRLSNFVGNEMAFVSYGKVLSIEDMEFLRRVENAGLNPHKEDIRFMERMMVASDYEKGIRNKETISVYEHCRRVAKYSRALCKALGLDDEETLRIEESALLHDIGRVVLPSTTYEPRKLTEDEWKVVRRHPGIGYKVLKKDGDGHLADGAGSHHERWDGRGYPDGKKRQEIPLVAAVISISDAYDSMVSGRPWKEAKRPQEALDEIVREAGKQFSPDVAKEEVVESLLAA